MKRLVEEVNGEGLEAFLGEKILLLCANYFYTGKLVGVNEAFVLLADASIVYETGPWSDSTYKDCQAIGSSWYVRIDMIESYGLGK